MPHQSIPGGPLGLIALVGLILGAAIIASLPGMEAVAQQPGPDAAGRARASRAAATARRARATVPDEVKTRFYNFDDLLIGGDLRKPTALFTTAREQVRLGRLLRLRRSFLPELAATARDPHLAAAGATRR